MDAAAFASGWAEGCAMDMEEAINYAVSPDGETVTDFEKRRAGL
jgi:hypothetical protein